MIRTSRYDCKLKLQSFDALLHWFPGDNQFRLSGGIVYNGNKIDAVGKPNASGSYTINGNTYSAANADVLFGIHIVGECSVATEKAPGTRERLA
ncbi:MAG TPA: hypothetical protein VJ577_02955 [Burkholderiaceae bacterium]|nr:hypothetical protein [Burkholderiaceae bacterium]